MASSAESERPPYYIFIANSSFLATQAPSPSSLLSHPNIQYHYLDDSPLALLPQSPDEHVLVLDYDPSNISHPTVKSISNGLAVTGTKVTDAPGAGVVHADDAPNKNDKMYIIHASSIPGTKPPLAEDTTSPQSILAKFKQRNLVLRRSLDALDLSPQVQSLRLPRAAQIFSSTSTPTRTPTL